MQQTNYIIILVLTIFNLGIALKVSPKVKCTPDTMRVEIPIEKTTGLVYLQGLKDYPDQACRPKTDPKDLSLAILELNLTDVYRCAITRVTNKITGKQIYYHTVVVEDSVLGPEIVHVKCSTIVERNHTVYKRNVFPAGFQEPDDISNITDFITARAPAPKLGVGVRQGGKLVTGELNVSPGTQLKMEIFLDQESAPIYGILVNNMQVTDTKTQEEMIITNGCAVDPYLFGNFNTTDGDFLQAEFRAFKFPDSTYVQFKGTVNVCLDMCIGVGCRDETIGYGRRKRAIPELPADPNKIFEISITSFIKVKDEKGEFEEIVKEQEKIYSDKKLIAGSQLKEKKFITSDPANFKLEKISEEEQEYIIQSSTTRSCNISFSLLAIATILINRLFL
ncbi:uncharacterized protein [Onthophagus taurus]|uniref:uncharacterized protein n=1 Tax=Onthophagus taurus TaxID=166361 RepID=UPI0039BE68BE